jgi:DNA-binding transcriptional LysR family regulator
MEQVQEGALDFAILYAAPARPGVIAELLFEERLVLVRTTPTDRPSRPEDHVEVDWGEDFAASYHAAFPDATPGTVSISYGPLALDYVLARGGSGYFRMAAVRSFIAEGRLALVPDAPEFSYSAYAVHSRRTQTSHLRITGFHWLSSAPMVTTVSIPGAVATERRARSQICTSEVAKRRNWSPAGVSRAPA